MIKGITHDEGGKLFQVSKYKGKLATGLAPGEGKNNTNYPTSLGYFVLMKEVTEVKKVGNTKKTIHVKKWVENTELQEKLVESVRNKAPRRLEIISLFKNPEDMWDSHMAMYSGSEGLLCKSHGVGTKARKLSFNNDGERVWNSRSFDGVEGCAMTKCPDYIAGKCKPAGVLKLFPVLDLDPLPYRLSTRSINTIRGIESALNNIWTLLCAAHSVREQEAGKSLPFDGMFGVKMYLTHKKAKSGGHDIFVTELTPTPEFKETVMAPIQRGLERKINAAKLEGSAGSMSLLDQSSKLLLEDTVEESEAESTNDGDKQLGVEMAVEFDADADKNEDAAGKTIADLQN